MSHIVERFCNVDREAGLLVPIDNTSERRESSIWISSAAILDIREHHLVTGSIDWGTVLRCYGVRDNNARHNYLIALAGEEET